MPGEVWHINDLEGHCILVALDALADSFGPQDHDFSSWYETLKLAGAQQVTPTEKDRVFFALVLKQELERLAALESYEYLSCGHTVYTHESALRQWRDREIEFPKRFAASREALTTVAPEKRLFGQEFLSREDAERIIREELDALELRLKVGHLKILQELDTNPPEGYVRERLADGLTRARKGMLEDARNQLWNILEPRIIKQ